MTGEKEQWKPIAGFEGYQVSSFGNVKSVERLVWNGKGYVHKPSMILKQARNRKGYPIVYLSHNNRQKTVPVHRLVASAFISNPFGKPQVNHINGDKCDNRIKNLECRHLFAEKSFVDTSKEKREYFENGLMKEVPNYCPHCGARLKEVEE